MALLENFVAAWVTVFAALLTAVAVLAYRRSRNAKVLGVAVAFALFFVKGLVVTVALFTTTQLDSVWLYMGLLDTLVLLAFYFAALRP